MALCSGNTVEHCCWVEGRACRFLEEYTVEGRHWACGLRRRLGSWDAVHSHPGYLDHVKSFWVRHGIPDCGDWPGPDRICGECGATG